MYYSQRNLSVLSFLSVCQKKIGNEGVFVQKVIKNKYHFMRVSVSFVILEHLFTYN